MFGQNSERTGRIIPDSHHFAIVAGEGDTDNSAFTIDGNELKLNVPVDFETKLATVPDRGYDKGLKLAALTSP